MATACGGRRSPRWSSSMVQKAMSGYVYGFAGLVGDFNSARLNQVEAEKGIFSGKGPMAS